MGSGFGVQVVGAMGEVFGGCGVRDLGFRV